MSSRAASKRKRVQESTGSGKPTRAKGLVTPADGAEVQVRKSRRSISPEHNEGDTIVMEERIISLRSHDVSTPILRKVRPNRRDSGAGSAFANGQEEPRSTEDMEISDAESEIPTPARRLYGRESMGGKADAHRVAAAKTATRRSSASRALEEESEASSIVTTTSYSSQQLAPSARRAASSSRSEARRFSGSAAPSASANSSSSSRPPAAGRAGPATTATGNNTRRVAKPVHPLLPAEGPRVPAPALPHEPPAAPVPPAAQANEPPAPPEVEDGGGGGALGVVPRWLWENAGLLLAFYLAFLLVYVACYTWSPPNPAQPRPTGTSAGVPTVLSDGSVTAPRSDAVGVQMQALWAELKEHQLELGAVHWQAEEVGAHIAHLNGTIATAEAAQREETQLLKEHVRAVGEEVGAVEGEMGALQKAVAAHISDADDMVVALMTPLDLATGTLKAEQRALADNATVVKVKADQLVRAYAAELDQLKSRAQELVGSAGEGTQAIDGGGNGSVNAATRVEGDLLQELVGARERIKVTSEQLLQHEAAIEGAVQTAAGAVRSAEGHIDEHTAALGRMQAEYAEEQATAIAQAQRRADEQAAALAAGASAPKDAEVVPPISQEGRPGERQEWMSAQSSVEFIAQTAESAARTAVADMRSQVRERFEDEVSVRTESILHDTEQGLAARLAGGNEQLQLLLRSTGYTHDNRGLGVDEDPGVEGGEGQQGSLGALSVMHDFSLGARGARVEHHRTMCRSSKLLPLTSPGYSDVQRGSEGLAAILGAPFQGVLGTLREGFSPSEEQRGSRGHRGAGAGRRASSAPPTTVTSHLYPLPDVYFAMANKDRAGGGFTKSRDSDYSVALNYAAAVEAAMAQVTVTLHSPVNVSVIKLVHATDSADPVLPACAPTVVRLVGWTEEPSKVKWLEGKVVDLGVHELEDPVPCAAYDGTPAPAHAAPSHVWERAVLSPAVTKGVQVPPLRAVTVLVLANAGQREFTCLHRLHVIGTAVL